MTRRRPNYSGPFTCRPSLATRANAAAVMRRPTLGGHIFAHDALRLDYCLLEAIASLLPVCDEVIFMDCASTDGTLEAVDAAFPSEPKLKIVATSDWDNLNGLHGQRLRTLANRCREHLTTDWQFMLQADEVLHEMSYEPIWEAVNSKKCDKYQCRRVDLWGDVDRCLFLDIDRYPANRRPMDCHITRLGRREIPAVTDAGELEHETSNPDWREKIVIYHYSMVRDPVVLNTKIIEMHTWYHNQSPDQCCDSQIVKWWKEGKPFDHTPWKTDAELQAVPYAHPAAAAPWVKRHRKAVGYDSTLRWCRRDDVALFTKLQRVMPAYPPNPEGALRAYSIEPLRQIVKLLEPRCLLEIGFHLGRSSAIWLHLGVEHVTSVDINPDQILQTAGDVLGAAYLKRFKLIVAPREDRDAAILYNPPPYDLIFIDGGHDLASVRQDIALARALGIRRMLFDDFLFPGTPDVAKAISLAGLKIHALFGGIAYCEEMDSTWTEAPDEP